MLKLLMTILATMGKNAGCSVAYCIFVQLGWSLVWVGFFFHNRFYNFLLVLFLLDVWGIKFEAWRNNGKQTQFESEYLLSTQLIGGLNTNSPNGLLIYRDFSCPSVLESLQKHLHLKTKQSHLFPASAQVLKNSF